MQWQAGSAYFPLSYPRWGRVGGGKETRPSPKVHFSGRLVHPSFHYRDLVSHPDGDEIARLKYTHTTATDFSGRLVRVGDVASYPDGDEIVRVKYTHPTATVSVAGWFA